MSAPDPDTLTIEALRLAGLLEAARDILRGMNFATPDGTRNRDLERVDALVTIGAGLALAPLVLAGTPPGDTAILALYRQWSAARNEQRRLAELPGNEIWNSPEIKAAEAAEDVAFWAMLDMTPQTMAGIAALAHVLWTIDGPCSIAGSSDHAEECGLPGNRLMLAIWRGASGAEGLPGEVKL